LSDRTRARQRRLWLTYSALHSGPPPLRDVTRALLDAFVTDLRTRKSSRTGEVLSARTAALVFNVIRAPLKRAARLKRTATSQATGGLRAFRHQQAGRALSADEIARLLAHDPDHRLHALWHVAASGGTTSGTASAAISSEVGWT
jgi:hypothetical protein